MSCSRCNKNRQRPNPPTSIGRPGGQVPRPAGQGPVRNPSDAIRNAIDGMKLPYVPPTATR